MYKRYFESEDDIIAWCELFHQEHGMYPHIISINFKTKEWVVFFFFEKP